MSEAEKRFSRVAILLLAVGGVAGAGMAFRQMLGEAGRIVNVPVLPLYGQVPDFSLTRETGQSLSGRDLMGRVWVADFIFTRCAGPCPLMTMRMAELQTELHNLDGVRLVSFSVDPEYDTPEVLARYAGDYGADPDRWTFLTGDRRAIYDLSIKGFKLAVATGGDYEHLILHSTKFVLVDHAAGIRGYYDGTDPEDRKKLAADVRALLSGAAR